MNIKLILEKTALWHILRKIRLLPTEWRKRKYEKRFDGKPFTPSMQDEIKKIIKKRRDIYFHNEKTARKITDNWQGELKKPNGLRFIENAIPVVMSANENFVPYMAVMLQSLLDYSNPDRKYHFIIFERDFSDETKDYLIKQVAGFDHCKIDFVNTKGAFEEIPIASPKDFHFSIDTFSRLFIPYWLDNYPKVIYCDGDMIAKADIGELYDIDIQDSPMAASIATSVRMCFLKSNYTSLISSTPAYLLLKNWSQYFSGGLLVFNIHKFLKVISYQELFKFAIYFTNRYRKHYVDQDVLNFLIKNEYFHLPQEWNYEWHYPSENGQSWQVNDPNIKIIHFSGNIKPWNNCPEMENNAIALSYREYAKSIPIYNERIELFDK